MHISPINIPHAFSRGVSMSVNTEFKRHREVKTMKDVYITIVGTQYRYGDAFLEEGMKVKLVKEPDNAYDKEAIKVELKPFGTIGYVANSTKTVIGECYSAGRLYDKIGDKAKAEIEFVTMRGIIARVASGDLKNQK